MARLTKKQAIEMTREKWNWHYHHPSKYDSWHFPKIRSGEWQLKFDCPCCEYVEQYGSAEDFNDCKRLCPLVWPLGRCARYERHPIIEDGMYYDQWAWARTNYYRKKYAKLIRDLPERK
jgi:hypothetical protein